MAEPVLISRPSPNYDVRRHALDMLVLHYTGMESGAAAIERLCDSAAKVSAHYVVEEDGQIFQLVDDAHRAWHAGVASWAEREDINSRSVGIEIVNGGHDFGLPDFPDAQIDSVIWLSQQICDRHKIHPHNVVGHSDIAPLRKLDPGERFPWEQLSEAGIGIWPSVLEEDHVEQASFTLAQMLSRIGYKLSEQDGTIVEEVLTAFQRRWAPHSLGHDVDLGLRALICAVARQHDASRELSK